MRELLGQGRIGQPFVDPTSQRHAGAWMGRWFFRREAVGGGVVMNSACTGSISSARCSGRIEFVSATTATSIPQRRLRDGRVVAVENADTAFATHPLCGGAVVQHEMSMIEAAGTDRFRMEIYGEEGTMWLCSERGALASIRRGETGVDAPCARRRGAGPASSSGLGGRLLGRAPRRATAREALSAGMLVAEAIAELSVRSGALTAVEEAEL